MGMERMKVRIGNRLVFSALKGIYYDKKTGKVHHVGSGSPTHLDFLWKALEKGWLKGLGLSDKDEKALRTHHEKRTHLPEAYKVIDKVTPRFVRVSYYTVKPYSVAMNLEGRKDFRLAKDILHKIGIYSGDLKLLDKGGSVIHSGDVEDFL